jgi:hypothetical protein
LAFQSLHSSPACRALSRALNTVILQLQLFGDWSPQRVSCILSSTKPVLLVIDCNKHSAFQCSQARRMSLDKLHSDGLLILHFHYVDQQTH